MAGTTHLESDVQYLKGVGPRRAALLRRLGIVTVRDLLLHLPRSYEDVSRIQPIQDLVPDRWAVIAGRILFIERRSVGNDRLKIVTVGVSDKTGVIHLIWFNYEQIGERLKPGQSIICAGKVERYRHELQMKHPQIVGIDRELPTDPFLPVYPLTQDLRVQELRRIMKHALAQCADQWPEIVPRQLLLKRGLPPAGQAVREVHFPPSLEAAEQARRRLAYEELLIFQLAFAVLRHQMDRERRAPPLRVTEEIDRRIRRLFPFSFTAGQNAAIADAVRDLQSVRPMHRLVQGDVGAGKTVVATYVLLVAVANRYQAALMAPTEVLARQHWLTLERYLAHSRVRRALLTGSLSSAERERLLKAIRDGEVDLVVGTHAIIQEDVVFHRLGVVVIDEQHKFGVRQRARFRQMAQPGCEPHYLVMTATPIPRTLTLTVFGDLDVSIIRDLPPGRQPVETRIVRPKQLAEVYAFVREKLAEGRQAYVICPRVEETDEALAAAEQLQAELALGVFRDFRVGLVHGRMSEAQKDAVMDQFRRGELHLLVATAVVEVGVDVPNATVMVIHDASRFGLAQLHQLRGRIARGSHPGYCFLVAEPKSEEARERLRVLASTTDGFEIAEADLRLRGPGEFFGTRQHGLPELRVANLARDQELVQWAREDAFELVRADPQLRRPEHAALRRELLARYGQRLQLAAVG